MRTACARPGVTLMELLVASLIGLVVILAISQVDVTRVLISEDIRRSTPSLTEASLIITEMGKSMQQADRINLVSNGTSQPGNVQLRLPVDNLPAGFDPDAAASYKWVQFRFDPSNKRIVMYDPASQPGCSVYTRFGYCGPGQTTCFSGLTINYANESPRPPGGEPTGITNLNSPDDNNVLVMTISWTDSRTGQSQSFTGQSTIRAGAYTNVSTGMAAPTVSPPPTPPCTNP